MLLRFQTLLLITHLWFNDHKERYNKQQNLLNQLEEESKTLKTEVSG